MAVHLRVQATISMANNVPADAVMNTFHFQSLGAPTRQQAHDTCVEQLHRFYTNLDGLIFPNTMGTNIQYMSFALEDAKPREPIDTTVLTLAPAPVDPLPHECAICVTWEADRESGIQIQSTRGRSYLGPLRFDVCNDGRVDSTTCTQIATAAEELLDEANVDGIPLVIYSPTRDASGASVLEACRPVVRGYVDNAFDTQRRRGVDATSRVLFPA